MDPQKAVKFYHGVRDFSETAAEYSLKHLPLDDELLQNACFLNFDKRLDADVLQAEYFVQRWGLHQQYPMHITNNGAITCNIIIVQVHVTTAFHITVKSRKAE